MNILEEIAEKRKIDIAARKERIPFDQMKTKAEAMAAKEKAENGKFLFPFQKSISGVGIHFICEVKKASPSKGIIVKDFPYLEIAREYEQAGASALSVLTEPEYFLGRDAYLQEIAEAVSLPVLRKDFTVDAYQIYEAKLLGASAVLLICSLLKDKELKKFLQIARSIGLSALVETHDQEEIKRALEAGAEIIGVNNRDLKTFQVDVNHSIKLRKLVPDNILFVSESGIKTSEDIKQLRENGTNGVLIGETLMRSRDKRAVLQELLGKKGECENNFATKGKEVVG